jgi:hypothetical protein
MKFLVLVAVISKLVTGVPQGTKGSIASPKPASPAAQTVSLEKGKTTTPPGCRKLSSDVDWPMRAEWRKALPEVSARSKTLAAGVYRPDYKVRAENYGDVQAAVKFAAKNNIRLTVINSGHDFLGRNDAPSGLSLDTSLLGGIQVHESFVPSEAGAAKPGAANIIVPAPGNQAAVTFGVGITTQVLNNALHPSKLLTIGAAHGEC